MFLLQQWTLPSNNQSETWWKWWIFQGVMEDGREVVGRRCLLLRFFSIWKKMLHKGIRGITKVSHDGKGCGSNRHLTIDGRNETWRNNFWNSSKPPCLCSLYLGPLNAHTNTWRSQIRFCGLYSPAVALRYVSFVQNSSCLRFFWLGEIFPPWSL